MSKEAPQWWLSVEAKDSSDLICRLNLLLLYRVAQMDETARAKLDDIDNDTYQWRIPRR